MFVEKILSVLQSGAEETVDLLGAMFTDLPTSHRRLRRGAYTAYPPRSFKTNWAEAYRKRQKFYTMLNYLKREGLVQKRKRKTATVWNITEDGKNRLRALREKKDDTFTMRYTHFAKVRGTGFTIVVFDIPEQERRKRTWVRVSLREMNFSLLQKSVWFGKGSIDKDFIHALRERKLLDFVHIFSVNKRGTLCEYGTAIKK